MEQQEIKEGNELIALFMGAIYSKHAEAWGFGNAKTHPVPIKIQNRIYKNAVWAERWEKELKFHSDWNWLMSAVDKIIELDITPAPNWSGYRIEIVPRGYVKISGYPMSSIYTNESIEGSLINAVYKAVVTFIKYYNEKS